MLESKRLIWKHWKDCHISLAYLLWGDENVTRYIGIHQKDILSRYHLEISRD